MFRLFGLTFVLFCFVFCLRAGTFFCCLLIMNRRRKFLRGKEAARSRRGTLAHGEHISPQPYGATLLCHLAVPPYCATASIVSPCRATLYIVPPISCHPIVSSYGATLWCHIIVPPYCAILLCHLIVPPYCATLLCHPIVLLYRDTLSCCSIVTLLCHPICAIL